MACSLCTKENPAALNQDLGESWTEELSCWMAWCLDLSIDECKKLLSELITRENPVLLAIRFGNHQQLVKAIEDGGDVNSVLSLVTRGTSSKFSECSAMGMRFFSTWKLQGH